MPSDLSQLPKSLDGSHAVPSQGVKPLFVQGSERVSAVGMRRVVGVVVVVVVVIGSN